MKANELIRARVEAFIQDYALWNAKFYRPGFLAELNWDAARQDFDSIVSRHFVLGEKVRDVGCSIGFPPEHSPDSEKIVAITEHPDTALVETESKAGVTRSFEYTLQRVIDEWRIARVNTFFGDSSEKVSDVDLNLLASKPPKPILAKDFPSGLDHLFDGPSRLQTAHGLANTTIRQVGTISAPSGFFACDDPGQWQSGAAVFEMPTPPGNHDIELVIDDNLRIVGAARVVFDRRAKGSVFVHATRKQSSLDHGQSHVIGVDGGMIGLADAGAIIALTARERERVVSRLIDASLDKQGRGAVFVPVTSSLQIVAIDSGCGDGGYASFWQLDNTGQPLALIFDFGDLAQPIWKTITAPFALKHSTGKVEGNDLKRYGFTVQFARQEERRLLIIDSERSTKAKVFNAENEMMFDSESVGCSVCGRETTYDLARDFPANLSGYIEVQLYLGHRYEFVPLALPE